MATQRRASSRPPIDVALPERTTLDRLGRDDLLDMLEGGREVVACQRALRQSGDSVVGALLRDVPMFFQWQHYPEGDAYDPASGSQYYYHAHPAGQRPGEHGHFHTFLRAAGMTADMAPATHDGETPWPSGDAALSHIVAISIDMRGRPTALFTVNRWVTGDAWYAAGDVCRMVDRFDVDRVLPTRTVDRWVSAMVRLFRPLVKDLVRERDVVMAAWRAIHGNDAFEDRNLEVVSQSPISVRRHMTQIRAALIG